MRRWQSIPGLRYYGGITAFTAAFTLLFLPLDFGLLSSLVISLFIGICVFLGLPRDAAEREQLSLSRFLKRTALDIRSLNAAGASLTASLQRQAVLDIAGMASGIVKMTQEQKKVDPELDHFLAYYLSRFLHLVDNYSKLEKDRYADEATKGMTAHIGEVIQEVRDIFSAQYNKILRHEFGDLASVSLELESMMELQRSQLGLSDLDDEFAKLGNHRTGGNAG
ncbi:5-bromo-4-chloroindolyl phosphate hydrolysis family protein [Paenibacillus tuaregi]|uniref:5-bromo-4-chloroindolyl phosphate hydrolysis family protein n=1 Tax=Paenibacillus tuaregi TaxID=1816681 RepID=UPI0008388E41|nr:5-bromo-4-chloroindolyl phosphate hydrolysis family protein [Paenibacillus tuaregi]